MVRAFRGAIRQLEGTQVAESPLPVEKAAKQDGPAAYQSNLPVIENINTAPKENSFLERAEEIPTQAKTKIHNTPEMAFYRRRDPGWCTSVNHDRCDRIQSQI